MTAATVALATAVITRAASPALPNGGRSATGGCPPPPCMDAGDRTCSLDQERLVTLIRDAVSSGARYRDLATALRAAIASGEVPIGTRLPPERELARLLSVGRTTVVAAYNLLRAESLIAMKQGVGTWVVRRP